MSFKSARKNAGLTMVAAAKALHVSRNSIWLWETGGGYPRADKIGEIAALYGCSTDELLCKEVVHEQSNQSATCV